MGGTCLPHPGRSSGGEGSLPRSTPAAHCSLLHQVTLQDERATLPRSTWLIALSFWPRENSRVLVAPALPLRHVFVCSRCLASSLSSGLVSCSRSAPSAPSRARPTSSRSNGTTITSEQRMTRTNSDAGRPEQGSRATPRPAPRSGGGPTPDRRARTWREPAFAPLGAEVAGTARTQTTTV